MTEYPTFSPASRFRFVLFVADGEPNSVIARQNFERIRNEELGGDVELTVVDVLSDADLALQHGIVVTPALLVLEPAPKVIVAGTLRDRAKVRIALRLPAPESV